MKFTLNLASKPEVPNTNKIIYSQDTFDKMRNSDWTKTLLEQNKLYIISGPNVQNIDYIRPIDIETCIGKILKWNDFTAEVEITSYIYKLIVKELYDNIELGMNYTCRLEKRKDGNIEALGMRIHSFSLIDKRCMRYL